MGVTLASSRGGFLGLLAASSFLAWRSRHRLRNLAIAGAAILIFVVALPVSPLSRFLDPSRSDEQSSNARLGLWRAGVEMALDHPLSGVGMGNFKSVVGEYLEPGAKPMVAHNVYIEIGAAFGFPGLLVFLMILFFSFRTLEQVRRDSLNSGESQLLANTALGLQAGLFGCSVAMFFVSAHTEKLLWLIVFLTMCLPSLARRSEGGEKRVRALGARWGHSLNNADRGFSSIGSN